MASSSRTQKSRRRGHKLPELQRWQTVLLRCLWTLILSFVILYLAIQIQPNQFSFMVEQFTSQPLLILLNYLPIFVLMVFFGSLTGNIFFGTALTELVVCGFSVASRIKCSIRQEPLYPRDLALIQEVGEAIRSYDIDFPVKIIAVVILFAAGMTVLGIVLRRYERKPLGLRGLIRWLHCVGSVAAAVILLFTLLASTSLYRGFTGTSVFNPMGAYNDLGVPYSFCHFITSNSIEKPKGFDEAEAAAWDSEETGETTSAPVNIVIVMNETFTDLVDNDAFTYTEENDPLSFYHSMIQREDVLSGHLVVQNLGGGTANSEFDVMTGIQSGSLAEISSMAFLSISGNRDSIFRMYKDAGYNTSYIHPGEFWFYNRYHILPWFGADSVTFKRDLEDPEMLGGYVSDDYTADALIRQFEADTANGELAFNFTTTIQNHMSYTLDKYGEDYDLPELACDLELAEETETELKVYIEGLRYADASLEKLITYFDTCGKPVLFAFFGDHYPYLGDDNYGFRQLGMEDDNKEYDFSLYEPPYFIWANDEAQEILDWDAVTESLALPERMSACYLGSAILEITGTDTGSPWFTFVNELRRTLPVSWREQYLDSQGNLLYTLDPENAELVSKWRCWAYYRLRYKSIPD